MDFLFRSVSNEGNDDGQPIRNHVRRRRRRNGWDGIGWIYDREGSGLMSVSESESESER